MRSSALTWASVLALALCSSATYAQSRSTDTPGSTSATPQTGGATKSQLPAGRSSRDTNKMGTVGPESPVDADAPNAAACKTITAVEERNACLAQAHQADKARAGSASGSAGNAATQKP